MEDEGVTQMQLRKICKLAGMEVVGSASNGEQGIICAFETRPDIILMDIKMPVLDGLSAAELILKELSVCIVMLTAFDAEEFANRAANLGTCGYILKPVTSSSLIPQLEVLYDGYTKKQNHPH